MLYSVTVHCMCVCVCICESDPYPLSLLPDPNALQQVVYDLGCMFAAVRGSADVGNLIWTSPVI